MREIVCRLAGLRTIDDVLHAWIAAVVERGARMGSYHFVPALASQVGDSAVIEQFGFPDDFVALYKTPEFRADDPIPAIVLQAARPMAWTEALQGQRLTQWQRAFIDRSIAMGVSGGFGVPLYGPNGREAYSSFVLDHPAGPADEPLLQEFMAIGQAAHLRLCVLVREVFMRDRGLSRRERDVLEWLARGKSTNDIGTILGLAAATVDTYTRRIYAKLEVNDRLGAVIVGIRQGIIRY